MGILKNFRFNVVLRVLLITLFAFILVYCITFTRMYVVTLLTGLTLAGLVFELIRYIDTTNRDVSGFLESIRHDDFSTTFHDRKAGRSFSELHRSLNMITSQFQRVRAEKETSFQYLQTIVRHVNVGLICMNQDGEVELMNGALRRLLRKPFLNHIVGLKKIYPDLYSKVTSLQQGERALVKVNVGNELKQLAIRAVEFKLADKPYRLISMQDIKGELEEQEVEAWQKLIRILTHEIMNSVSPIVSLTSTIQDMLLEDSNLDRIEGIQDLKEGVGAIHKRSQGLIHFTEAYRDLTRIPQPNIQEIEVETLFHQIQILFKTGIEEKEMELHIEPLSQPLILQADPELIEQVLINLVQNAMDALEGRSGGLITLRAWKQEEGKTCLQVRDNGPGIPEDVLEQVFVPFFTTKKTGSGIGLSFSRQIMRLHKGTITVISSEKGSEFTLLI